MPEIREDSSLQTIITTYEVSPVECQDLLDHLTWLIKEVFNSQPGFISASLHVNDARTRVANYSQWETREAFQNMLKRESIQPHIRRTADLCRNFEPVLFEVVFARVRQQ